MSPIKQKDPSITYLNAFGFNVIKLPRVGINPLDLIGKDKTMEFLDPLETMWTSPAKRPDFDPPYPASMVNGQKTAALDLTLGLNILANTLAVFGASVPSLDFSHTSAKSIQFSYANVSLVRIGAGALGDYIPTGRLKAANLTVQRYFGTPGAEVFLITDVLRSSSITITAMDSNSNGVSLDVPAIQGVVGAKVSVKPSNSSSSTLTFASTDGTAVNFGFKAVRLTLVSDLASGQLTYQGVDPNQNIAFGAPSYPGLPRPEAEASGNVVFETPPDSCLLDID